MISSKNVYHIAAKNCLTQVISEANSHELNKRDEYGRTPVHYAALKGHVSALKQMVTHGGKACKCDLFGNSALHYAVRSQNLNCISFLVNYEPKLVWMMDNNDQTAKQLAQTLEYSEVVGLLNCLIDQMNLDLNEFYKFQSKEFKNAEKRRKKYICQMNKATKRQLSEFRRKNCFSFNFNFEFSKIRKVDENVTLRSASLDLIKLLEI